MRARGKERVGRAKEEEVSRVALEEDRDPEEVAGGCRSAQDKWGGEI
jgi:hypothetical protein